MAELNFGLAKSVEKTVMTLHVPWHGQLCMSLKESIKRIKYTKKLYLKKIQLPALSCKLVSPFLT